MLEKVNNEEIDPKSIFFSDEAWFNLHGHPAPQNDRYWSSEKPNIVQEAPLYDSKVEMWCETYIQENGQHIQHLL